MSELGSHKGSLIERASSLVNQLWSKNIGTIKIPSFNKDIRHVK